MTRYFTSDTHFSDHRVLNLYHRPFASLAAMDEALIEAWNAVCGPHDEIWHLGDFARTAAQAAAILPRLNGQKHLVVGNNDPAPAVAQGWRSVQPYAELEEDGRKLVLCHYPFRSWNGQHRGAINLHGHSHGRMKPLPARSTSASMSAAIVPSPWRTCSAPARLDSDARGLACCQVGGPSSPKSSDTR